MVTFNEAVANFRDSYESLTIKTIKYMGREAVAVYDKDGVKGESPVIICFGSKEKAKNGDLDSVELEALDNGSCLPPFESDAEDF